MAAHLSRFSSLVARSGEIRESGWCCNRPDRSGVPVALGGNEDHGQEDVADAPRSVAREFELGRLGCRREGIGDRGVLVFEAIRRKILAPEGLRGSVDTTLPLRNKEELKSALIRD